MSRSSQLSTLLLNFFTLTIVSLVGAIVPQNATFRIVNAGEFGPYITEYDASYRVLDPFNPPFQLCFYNTTPNAFTLALRMGLRRSESLFRWVWEANRANPVRENATLTFGSDGNLILAEHDGRVKWETKTANRGVTGFKLLSNGNIVLHDAEGNFVWQSFNHPTDTVLVGQTLRVGSKLVSRKSDADNVDGVYSLAMESNRFALYYGQKFLYYATSDMFNGASNVTFYADTSVEQGGATEVGWQTPSGGLWILTRPKYNATSSFLRLGIDGNVRIFTYNDRVDYGAWEMTYRMFDRDSRDAEECQLPGKCGKLGVCEDSQCVACPTPGGLMGWSVECGALKLTSCRPSEFEYFTVVGVDHFLSKYTGGVGPTKASDCAKKCTGDCQCLGYFYHQMTSRCWIAYQLGTLTRVRNSTHLGFIKAPKTKSL